MEILKIVEALEAYSEDTLAYKLNSGFAHAVTEAISLLIWQGEQIADLQNELQSRWISVKERMPEENGRYLCNVKSYVFRGSYYLQILQCDKFGFRDGHIYTDDVTHWMELPETIVE